MVQITVDEEGKKVSRSDSYTNRGYTGHESIQETENLIHMNGRIYDSSIGRFISADPHIQAPNDTQSYNRYSYVKNNPLKYTDPSGYFFSGLKKWFKKHWKAIVTTVATAAVGFLTAGASFIVQGAAIGFTAGAVGTLASGGSLGSALKNGIIGGIFGAVGAGLSFGIGSSIGSLGGKALAHGATSAFMTRARGGKWNSGFWSGFAGTMLSPLTGMAKGYYAKVASSAIVAGTISTISGGKFANGAMSGAFRFMFNEWKHKAQYLLEKTAISSNFLAKYWFGFGGDMNIDPNSHMGLRLKLALRTQISDLRTQIASDVDGGIYGRYSESYNLTNESILFAIGDGSLKADVFNMRDSYKIHFFIRDEFVDALDINDQWSGNQDIGIPYDIKFDFYETYKK